MTRAQALLLGFALLGLGAAGYGLFQASGLEGFSPGIAASALVLLLVVGWTGTYLARVVTGRMPHGAILAHAKLLARMGRRGTGGFAYRVLRDHRES